MLYIIVINCFFSQVKAAGNIVLTATAATDFTGGAGANTATNDEITARLNLIETQINGLQTPTCS